MIDNSSSSVFLINTIDEGPNSGKTLVSQSFSLFGLWISLLVYLMSIVAFHFFVEIK